MDVVARIAELVGPALAAMGFELVRVRITGGQRVVLQIMAERPDGSMSIDDCAEVSRAVSALLDVEDPMPGAYALEVSSPGLDRPLVKLADFERYAGFEAKLETRLPIDGRRRFRGLLMGVAGRDVKMMIEGTEVILPFDQISAAKLILTDALIAASAKGRN